jgi:hypothetical protein
LLFGGVAVATLFLVYSCWWYLDLRFFFPVLPLIFGCAALGAARLVRGREPRARRTIIALVVLAYALQPIGVTVSGDGRWTGLITIAGQYLRGPPDSPRPDNYLHVLEVNAFMARAGATRGRSVVLGSLNLLYQEWLSNGRYGVLPLHEDQVYAPELLGAGSVGDACADRLAAGVEVFASDFQASDHPASVDALRERFDLELVDTYLDGRAHLFRVRARRP